MAVVSAKRKAAKVDRLPKTDGAMLGVATAPITIGKGGRVLLVGVIEREARIEGVLTTRVARDGTDSTARIASMVRKSRFAPQIKFIALDGISVAGMNVVDIARLEKRLGVSCVSITRKRPRRELMRGMVSLYGERNGIDVSRRLHLLDATLKEPVHIEGVHLLTKIAGPRRKVILVKRAVNTIRLAHLIASGVSRGESRGRL